jgi:hypothetical protein
MENGHYNFSRGAGMCGKANLLSRKLGADRVRFAANFWHLHFFVPNKFNDLNPANFPKNN